MEYVIVTAIVGAALIFLYRKFRPSTKSDSSSCGCSGCGDCDPTCKH